MSPEVVKFFATFIEKKIGVVYDSANQFQLENRLENVVKFYGLASVEALYLQALGGLTQAQEQFILDMATNNETSFFRDIKVFNVLKNKVIPELVERRGLNSINIWSAACSTGQEAYSLAILNEELNSATSAKKFNYSILASDVSEKALSKAKSALYSQLDVQRGLPTNILLKYFQNYGNCNWVANSQIQNSIQFKKLNLTEVSLVNENYDLILCRNVLIYHRQELKKKIIANLEKKIRDGGYLVLGSGESLIGLNSQLEFQTTNEVTLYKKKNNAQSAA